MVDHFAYTSVVFGVLPLGTANSFARTLGIPLDLAGAIDVLVNGKVANIDLAKINEDYFANGSSIGMPAIVGRATPHSLKKWLGRGCLWPGRGVQFMASRRSAASSRSTVEQTSFQAFDVLIASRGYQVVSSSPRSGPLRRQRLHPHAKGPSRSGHWQKSGLAIALGVPFGPSDLEVIRVPELTIDTVPQQYVAVDGAGHHADADPVSVAREALH